MLDLSAIEANGEQFLTTAAQNALAKVKPSFFTPDTQTAVNVAITAGVAAGIAILTAYLNRNKAAAPASTVAGNPAATL